MLWIRWGCRHYERHENMQKWGLECSRSIQDKISAPGSSQMRNSWTTLMQRTRMKVHECSRLRALSCLPPFTPWSIFPLLSSLSWFFSHKVFLVSRCLPILALPLELIQFPFSFPLYCLPLPLWFSKSHARLLFLQEIFDWLLFSSPPEPWNFKKTFLELILYFLPPPFLRPLSLSLFIPCQPCLQPQALPFLYPIWPSVESLLFHLDHGI